MIRKTIATFLCAIALSSAAIAHADTVALRLRAETLGEITGDGQQGTIECLAITGLDFELISQSQWNEVVKAGTLQCLKKIDRASPLLMQALLARKQITDGRLTISRTGQNGQSQVVASVMFTGRVTQLQQTLATTAEPAKETVGFRIDTASLEVSGRLSTFPQ
jgi:type VI secretion system Hcp family effector